MGFDLWRFADHDGYEQNWAISKGSTAEMPTSGDLKSGDCLFLLPPGISTTPPERFTQPPMGMT